MKIRITLALLLVSTSLMAHKGMDGVQKLHVNKGSEFLYAVRTENANTTTMMGNENVTTVNASMKGAVKALDASSDSTVFSINMRNAVIDVKGMHFFGLSDTTFKFDDLSAARENVVTAASGRVIRREHKHTEVPPGSEQIVMRQLSGNRNPLHNMFVAFPDKPLSPGFEWAVSSVDTNDQGTGVIITSLSMRYTFDGTMDTLGMKCGRIKAKSERFVVNGTMKQMGREVTVDGDGIVNSVYVFELSNGMPVSISSHTQLDQRISIGEGMEIPTSSDIKSTISRLTK